MYTPAVECQHLQAPPPTHWRPLSLYPVTVRCVSIPTPGASQGSSVQNWYSKVCVSVCVCVRESTVNEGELIR